MYSNCGRMPHSLKHQRWACQPSIHPYTDHKWDNLPHAICTSELEWDPSFIMTLEKMSSGEKYQPLSPSVMRLVTTLSFMVHMRQN
jgi:hypothetical protein